MIIKTKVKILILIASLLFNFDACASNTELYETNVSTNINLLQKYAPILCMHPDERFHPTDVKVMLTNSKLCKKKWNGCNEVEKTPTLRLLMKKKYNEERYNLQLTENAKDLLQDKNHWKTDQTVYGRKFSDKFTDMTVLQYWFFYVYNDWQNKHEGDWEMIQIILDNNEQPKHIVYSIHHGGQTLQWDDSKVSKDYKHPEHPLIYVTLGGHGCWNEPGDHRWYLGKYLCFDCVDETEKGDSLYPNIEPFTSKKYMIYELKDISTLKEKDWIYWNGYWGNQKMGIGNSGPPSPPYIDYIDEEKRLPTLRWENPISWARKPNPLTYFICASANSKIIVRNTEGNNMRLFTSCKPTKNCGSCPDVKVAYSEEDQDLVFIAYSLDGNEVDLEISKYNSGMEVFKEMYTERYRDRNVAIPKELDLEFRGHKRKEGVEKVVFNKLAIPKGGKATFLFSKELNRELKMNIYKNDGNIFESDISPNNYEYIIEGKSTIKGDGLPNSTKLEQMREYENILEDDRFLDNIESKQMSE